jgi:hypothetical protein
MELDILKNFVRMHVEVLVGGVWIDGFMTPIVKSLVTLLPAGETKEFYGPTALKAEVIQAIRQVKSVAPVAEEVIPAAPTEIKSTVQSAAKRSR